MKRFVVYMEDVSGKKIDRWFYGIYNSEDRANEVALELGSNYPIFYCVCDEEDCGKLKINNLPISLL